MPKKIYLCTKENEKGAFQGLLGKRTHLKGTDAVGDAIHLFIGDQVRVKRGDVCEEPCLVLEGTDGTAFVEGIKDACNNETGEIEGWDVELIADHTTLAVGKKLNTATTRAPREIEGVFDLLNKLFILNVKPCYIVRDEEETEADTVPKKVRGRIVRADGKDYGRVGVKTPYHDCNGKRLVVGDIVRVTRGGTVFEQPVVYGELGNRKKFFIMGIERSCDDRTGEIGDDWKAEKVVRYTELKDGPRTGNYLTFRAD